MNPCVFGVCVFRTLFATHAVILTSLLSTVPYSTASSHKERSPTSQWIAPLNPKLRRHA